MSHALECTSPEDGALKKRSGVPASQLTTFGIGGEIATLYEPQTLEALCGLVKDLHARNESFHILGAGSNVVIGDSGLRAPVIRLGRGFAGFIFGGEGGLGDWMSRPVESAMRGAATGRRHHTVYAGAAAPLMSLSREVSQRGLSGLEFAAGIPATIGGAARMNAGAHNRSISEVVRRVLVVTSTGNVELREAADLGYSYRHSALRPGEIVVACELELEPGESDVIRGLRASCLEYRKRTQPLNMPSAGSVFKNPSPSKTDGATVSGNSDKAAAELLEACGLKGRELGGIGYSAMHSNWLVRLQSSGRASEVTALIDLGKREVLARFGVRLESEILIWDEQNQP